MYTVYYLESWEETKAICESRHLKLISHAHVESGPHADDMTNEITDKDDHSIGVWYGGEGWGWIAESLDAFYRYVNAPSFHGEP